MLSRVVSREVYAAEVAAVKAAHGLNWRAKNAQLRFLSCLRPPGLFEFATAHAGVGPLDSVGNPTGRVALGEFHRELCAAADAGGSKALWLLPRGHLKSTLLTCCEALRQCLYYWPDQHAVEAAGGKAQAPPKIGVISWSQETAADFLLLIRAMAGADGMAEKYEHALWPQGPPVGTPWNGDRLAFRNGATIRAWGLKSLPTSKHADQLYCDDLVTPENANSAELIGQVKERFRLLHSVLDPGGRMWVIGTHYHHADLYTDLRDAGQWQTYKRTCYAPDGSPAFGEAFTAEHLEAIKEEQGPYVFSCQYLLDPISEEERVFRPEWLKFDVDRDARDGVVTVTVDPAISQGEDACFTAITVVISKRLGGEVHRHVAYAMRQRLDASATIDAIMSVAERWNPVEIGIEAIQYQASLVTFLGEAMRRRGRWWNVTAIKGHGGKTKLERIRALQPYFARGLFHLGEDQQFVVDELMQFPKGKYCDTIDSLSMHLDLDAFQSSAGVVNEDDIHELRAIASRMGRQAVGTW